MAIRRADVEKFAEEHGIELEITEFSRKHGGRTFINHVHAYTKDDEVFGSSDLHNLSLWDMDCAAAINWADVLADLCDHMPVPCPDLLANGGSGCEVCDEERLERIAEHILQEREAYQEQALQNEIDAELLLEYIAEHTREKGGTV